MNAGWIRLLGVSIALCLSQAAQAQTACSALSSPGFSTALGAQNPPGLSTLPNITSFTFTINCTRASAADPASVLVKANNGANRLLAQNRARFPGGTYLNYEVYADSACSGTPWTNTNNNTTNTCNAAGNCISVPLNVGANLISTTVFGCVPTGQTSASSGNYADSVGIRIRNAANTAWLTAETTFPVSITNPASCAITSVGNVDFTYTSFQPTDATANSTITLNCTYLLPYEMSLDASSGTIIGLNYTLQIDNQAPPVRTRAILPPQTHTINGRMVAGQSGTCNQAVPNTDICSSTQPRQLTVTW